MQFDSIKALHYQKNGSSATPLRVTSYYEIEYQLSDGGESHIGGRTYPIRRGQMVLAKPGMQRYTKGAYICLAIHFSSRNQALVDALNQQPDVLSPFNSLKVEELLWEAYKIKDPDTVSGNLRLEGLLMQILAEYMEVSRLSLGSSREYSAYTSGIYESVEYIRRHYPEHITSEILARRMFISTNFYQKVFKEIVGVPPAQFLRNIRISEACRLLSNTDISVQEIGEQCGFHCASYFIYTMKKQLGITPLEYRKRNRTLI